MIYSRDRKGLLTHQLKYLDKAAIDLGLDERILIENASSNLFKIIDELDLGKKVCVIAGKGNNGADVLSCARKLKSRGYTVEIVIVAQGNLGDEASFQRNILDRLGIGIYNVSCEDGFNKLSEVVKNCDFVLDGLLGIGFKGELSLFLNKVITLINGSSKKIVACDIPSGLCPDQGVKSPVAIKANYTISFIDYKKGFFTQDGRSCCGEVFVVDIGISKDLLERYANLNK